MKMIQVNTLAVAKRWKKRMVEEKKNNNFTGAEKRIGIWEIPYQVVSERQRYGYTENVRYVVGNVQAVKYKVNHLGARVDEEDL
mgnify:FL=1|tara:strand:+ start:190 stop:441 length:252 start_codon:yes stop_codon:yes gene_type:complete